MSEGESESERETLCVKRGLKTKEGNDNDNSMPRGEWKCVLNLLSS